MYAKKIIAASILLIAIFAISSQALCLDKDTVKDIGTRMAKAEGQDVRIDFNDSDGLEAYLHPMRHIVLSRGLLQKFDEQEMAFIIGHETAHLLKGHYMKMGSEVESLIETDADTLAAHHMRATGFDPTASFRALAKMATYGMADKSAAEERIRALNLQMQHVNAD